MSRSKRGFSNFKPYPKDQILATLKFVKHKKPPKGLATHLRSSYCDKLALFINEECNTRLDSKKAFERFLSTKFCHDNVSVAIDLLQNKKCNVESLMACMEEIGDIKVEKDLELYPLVCQEICNSDKSSIVSQNYSSPSTDTFAWGTLHQTRSCNIENQRKKCTTPTSIVSENSQATEGTISQTPQTFIKHVEQPVKVERLISATVGTQTSLSITNQFFELQQQKLRLLKTCINLGYSKSEAREYLDLLGE